MNQKAPFDNMNDDTVLHSKEAQTRLSYLREAMHNDDLDALISIPTQVALLSDQKQQEEQTNDYD